MRIVVNNLYKGDTTDRREKLRVRCCDWNFNEKIVMKDEWEICEPYLYILKTVRKGCTNTTITKFKSPSVYITRSQV